MSNADDAPGAEDGGPDERGWLYRVMRFCLENKLVVVLAVVFVAFQGLLVAPFDDLGLDGLPRDPVPVDAIPDTGENQQIVFTEWPGRSPQDIEDQITYPLTVALLGVPGVETIRSNSMFGFSSIFVIFEDDIDFYWSRSRILEKLASLPTATLPDGVQPTLGPDATALGQIFWYTLEGQDEDGNTVGGFGLEELRSVQDWYVRYGLASVDGVAEVASIGGYVREYQIDVDPDAMRAYGVTLDDVFGAVRMSNVDVGARTIELNRAEYVVRGLGLIESLDDIENTVVAVADNVPITVAQIGHVQRGPALRRGALDKSGAEVVGGVVVARYGSNPLAVIERVKAKIDELEPGLPRRTLDDGTVARVHIVPFYDRTELIHETLGTLTHALRDEILVTLVVVLVMVAHLQSAALIAGLLPLAVLMCFIAMKQFGVGADIVALSGIAIAIGTMVDMGIVLTENILRHLQEGEGSRKARVLAGASEVGGAVMTAVLTTIVGFLPVFAMQGAEGKMFAPLAYTKTFALFASIVVAVLVIPPLAHLVMRGAGRQRRETDGAGRGATITRVVGWLLALAITVVLANTWEPLGPAATLGNVVLVVCLLGGLLVAFKAFQSVYEPLLRLCLRNKLVFSLLPVALCVLGVTIWLGFATVFAFVPPAVETASLGYLSRQDVRQRPLWQSLADAFPGLGREFMPSLDEGSFLLMPVTMNHVSIGEALDLMQIQNRAVRAIPEVADVVGKIGRVDSPLDPAPVAMVETVITYVPEYVQDDDGGLARFRFVEEVGEFARDEGGELIPDPDGRPFRQWRDEIDDPDDIWREIQSAARIPGMTTAAKLQPIETRRIMLQTGMRAPLGVKVQGPDLRTIERVGIRIEELLKQVPAIRADTVSADRIIGKPYLEIDIDREAIARFGLHVRQVQDVIEVAIGGRMLTETIEGRERYPVRVRYMRELRDDIENLERILVPAPDGTQVPLGQLAEIRYEPGPQSIKSEDTFLTGYVVFDRQPGRAEVEVVEQARAFLEQKIEAGELEIPAGVSYRFAGSYEQQVRAARRLRVIMPLALFVIFLLLYLQFRSVAVTGIVFSGVFVAWSGGFLMLWLYGQPWFLDLGPLGGDAARELFQIEPVNLSVAVWVGFLALFGIATDDGVVMSTYISQSLRRHGPRTVQELREAVVRAALRRIRPCLMTSATTLLALLPILTSTGRGSDVMVPMAIPSFGGMAVVLLTVFVVPSLYCAVEEAKLRWQGTNGAPDGA